MGLDDRQLLQLIAKWSGIRYLLRCVKLMLKIGRHLFQTYQALSTWIRTLFASIAPHVQYRRGPFFFSRPRRLPESQTRRAEGDTCEKAKLSRGEQAECLECALASRRKNSVVAIGWVWRTLNSRSFVYQRSAHFLKRFSLPKLCCLRRLSASLLSSASFARFV